jgi:hypothetical protein
MTESGTNKPRGIVRITDHRSHAATPTTTMTTTTPGTASPTAAATAALLGFTATLTDSTLKQSVEQLGNAAITAYAKLRRQDNILKAFDDDDHVPRSARFQFQLRGSSAVSGSPEFMTLQQDCALIINTAQKKLTAKIKALAELERNEARNKFASLMVSHICIWAKICIAKGDIPAANCSDQHYRLFNAAIAINEVKEIIDILAKPVLLGMLQAAFGVPPPDEDDESSPPSSSTTSRVFTPPTSIETGYLRIVSEGFIAPLQVFDSTTKLNAFHNTVNAIMKSTLTETATVATAEMMDVEQTINSPTMKSLIESTVRSELKKAARTNSDQSQPHNSAKNRARGASKGAPSTKKPTNTKKAAPNRPNLAASSAGANGNDSTAGSKRKPTNNTQRPARKRSPAHKDKSNGRNKKS